MQFVRVYTKSRKYCAIATALGQCVVLRAEAPAPNALDE
jgi:hypothetical protein